MKKLILIVLSLSLAILPAVSWAVCCASISAGPVAYAPEFSKVGCSRSAKVSYGGNANIQCDPLVVPPATTVIETSKLYVVVAGMGDALAASKVYNTDVRCGANTIVATFTQTPGCSVLSGQQCYSQYTIKTTACASSPAQTVTVNGASATCP